MQVKTAGPQSMHIPNFDASIKIFNNDEYPREELAKVDEVPSMVLRVEIGASIFDQDRLSESGLESSKESESEIPDEFNCSYEVNQIRQHAPRGR